MSTNAPSTPPPAGPSVAPGTPSGSPQPTPAPGATPSLAAPRGSAPSVPAAPELTRELHDKLELRISQLESFKATILVVVQVLAVLGVGTLGWGLFKGYFGQVLTKLEASEQASKRAQDAIEIEAVRSVGGLKREMFRILDGVSRSSRDAELLIRIEDAKETLSGLVNLKPHVSARTGTMIDALSTLLTLTQQYAKAVRPDGNKWDSQHGAFVNATMKKWSAQDLTGLRSIDGSLADQIDAHAQNALGSMELALAREGAGGVPASYAKAREYFQAALVKDPTLSKAHMNLGVIDAIEWSELQDPASIVLLNSALKHYTDAANLATSSLLLSTAYNNLGDVSLQRGRWFAERAQLDQAREALADAKRHIRRALAQAEPQPVGYVTLAEIECSELGAGLTGAPSPARYREVAAGAFARLQLAVDLGYGRFKNQTVQAIEARWPSLCDCRLGRATFVEDVAQL